VITDTATELLKARGEPACFENLIGDLLVGLDRSGQLARLARQLRPLRADQGWDAWVDDTGEFGATETSAAAGTPPRATGTPPRATDEAPEDEESPEPPGPVDDLLALISGELNRTTNRRVRQIEPGQYWLGSEEDRSGAAQPLADRVEWAIFSLLSSSRQMTEAAVFERTMSVFRDRDAPDATLLRACLDSYSAPGSTPEAIVTGDQLERRSAEHDAMIATGRRGRSSSGDARLDRPSPAGSARSRPPPLGLARNGGARDPSDDDRLGSRGRAGAGGLRLVRSP